MTAAIDATHGLLAYKNWRLSLVPLTVGTVLTFTKDYLGATQSSSISAGTNFVIKDVVYPSGSQGESSRAVYTMILVSPTGKEFKRRVYWGVEEIARRIELGSIVIKAI